MLFPCKKVKYPAPVPVFRHQSVILHAKLCNPLIQKLLSFYLLALCSLSFSTLSAQTLKLSGVVTDYFSKKPLESVSVITGSGHLVVTDSAGKYEILVNRFDSVWFSYLSKNTMKYRIDTITNLSDFEVALYIDAHWLPAVKVQSSSYTLDSLQNRRDYAKVFNFHKPGLAISSNPPSTYVPGGLTVGLDLDALINSFRFKRTRQMLSLQQRLIEEEHDKYINHRFTKLFVKQVTGLAPPVIDTFMMYYRPSYELLLTMNDLELGNYIEQCYKSFMDIRRRFPLH